MKRWRLLICLTAALCAGALVNAGTALSCALWSRSKATELYVPVTVETPPEWTMDGRIAHGGKTKVSQTRRGGFGVVCDRAELDLVFSDGTVEIGSVERFRSGWPLASFQSEFVRDGGRARKPQDSARGGLTLPDWAWPERAPSDLPPVVWRNGLIPARPVALGMLVNTALYSVVFLALAMLPRTVARTFRVRGDRCASCGYDRRGLVGGADAKCPECGTTPTRG